MCQKRIENLSVDEYFYLTENLDLTDKNSIKKGVEFIIHNKRQGLVDVVRKIINDELSDFERIVLTEHLGEGISAEEIQHKYRIPHTSFYRYLNRACNKLKNAMKYVLIYEQSTLLNSAEELIEYVKKSEN